MILRPDPRDMVQLFKFSEDDVTTGPAAPVQVVDADPSRITLVLSVTNGASTFFSLNSSVAVNQGILLTNTMHPLILRYSDLGAVVGLRWFAIPMGAMSNIHVLTVSYYPTSGG
jgi:hypothetical protein